MMKPSRFALRTIGALGVLLFLSFSSSQAWAYTTTFFNNSLVATPVNTGVTSDTILCQGYLFTYTRDKLFTGGLGPDPIGRPVRVAWPSGVEAQAVTTGPTVGGAQIILKREDNEVFDLTTLSIKLLANTAGAGASLEIMPVVNGEDAFSDPIALDATGYYSMVFSYGAGATTALRGYSEYKINLYTDFALTAATLDSLAVPEPAATGLLAICGVILLMPRRGRRDGASR